MTPFVLAMPAGACGWPRVFAPARAMPRAPHSAGTPGLCRARATKSLHHRTTPCLPVPAASAKLRAACSAVVLLPAAAAAAAPLDPAAVETVQQVGPVLNMAVVPLALVLTAVLFEFLSLKSTLARMSRDLGTKTDGLGTITDGLGKKTDGLGKKLDGLGKKMDGLGKTLDDFKSSLTVVLGILSLLTLFTAYNAFAVPK